MTHRRGSCAGWGGGSQLSAEPLRRGHCPEHLKEVRAGAGTRSRNASGRQICGLAVAWRACWKGRLEARSLVKELSTLRWPTEEVAGDGALDYGVWQ